jgi:hypothetical protein
MNIAGHHDQLRLLAAQLLSTLIKTIPGKTLHRASIFSEPFFAEDRSMRGQATGEIVFPTRFNKAGTTES